MQNAYGLGYRGWMDLGGWFPIPVSPNRRGDFGFGFTNPNKESLFNYQRRNTMTKEQMKQALARINGNELTDTVDCDWGDIGSRHGEAAAKAVESAMETGDKALDYLGGLWVGFKYARAKRAGLIAE